jgi:hypothetical protein
MRRSLRAHFALPALALACCSSAAAAPTAPAPAPQHKPTIYQSPYLWATINVCNGRAEPKTVGIRASMPGSGIKREEMFMRFELQYQGDDGGWRALGTAADSGFLDVGSATYRARQSGRTFQVSVAPAQQTVLRGQVSFQWRRGARIVRHALETTTPGHVIVTGAASPGFSAAACALG